MRKFTKIVSMVMVAVMCFGLFATSAYAFDFGGGSSDAGFADQGGFSFGGDDSFAFSGGASEPAGGGSGSFVMNPVEDEPEDSGSSFAFSASDEPQNDAQDEIEGGSFSFKGDEADTFEGDEYDKKQIYTFTINPSSVDKTNPVDVAITGTGSGGAVFGGNTFSALKYTLNSANYENPVTISSKYLTNEDTKVTIRSEFIKDHASGVYYLFGVPSNGGAPCEIGVLYINTGSFGPFTVSGSPYDKYAATFTPVRYTGANMDKLNGFGIASTTGAIENRILAEGNDYSVSGNIITLTKNLLNSLPDGSYYLIGNPSSTADQVNMGKFTVKSTTDTGHSDMPGLVTWTLSPDYYTSWTSGDDVLLFWSNMMRLRKLGNASIILRYGMGASSIPNRTIDANQYWDFETIDGAFGLGTNFLSSLASGTYTLQVINLKTMECTNVVQFRIGATLRPIDTDKHVIGSIKNLRFLSDDPIQEVYVGNIPLTYGEDYALSANRKTVTLSYEFLNRRSAGYDYTVKVRTDFGDYPSATFHILSTAQGSASPRTGDESNLGLWAAFLLLSGTAVVVLVPKLRRHEM